MYTDLFLFELIYRRVEVVIDGGVLLCLVTVAVGGVCVTRYGYCWLCIWWDMGFGLG